MEFVDLGTISFKDAYEFQTETLRKISAGDSAEIVCLLEHPHVFTTGRRGADDNVLASVDFEARPLEVIRINRGGDVTYHGPGQLVVYPILDLRRRGRDLNRYLRELEDCVIRTSTHFGVRAYRREGLTGVWTAQGKLASIGVGVRRWITMHGLALNVSTELSYFGLINPCGIPECPVTSLEQILGHSVDMEEVKKAMRRVMTSVFAPVNRWTGGPAVGSR